MNATATATATHYIRHLWGVSGGNSVFVLFVERDEKRRRNKEEPTSNNAIGIPNFTGGPIAIHRETSFDPCVDRRLSTTSPYFL